MSRVNVYGAGAFGTALAISLANQGNETHLVPRSTDHCAALTRDRENKARLPGAIFPNSLIISDTPVSSADANLIAVPTPALGELVKSQAKSLDGQMVIACCKGVDLKTGLGPTGIIAANCDASTAAILSGPSFAVDIAVGLPTALTIAAPTDEQAQALQRVLQFSKIRLYSSNDIRGVELGGALKNVIAIAAGITIGAGLGESARAAVVTRGFHEMERFAVSKGASRNTLSGLSGLGDLVLTCTSPTSRNFSHGLALGKGQEPDSSKTVEGTRTAAAIAEQSKIGGIDMPITGAVADFLAGNLSIEESIGALFARPLKKE